MKLTSRVTTLTFVGGLIGTAARYLLSTMPGIAFSNYWVVNVLGSIAIAFFVAKPWFQSDERRAFFITGLAGGFTTMSGLTMMIFYSWQEALIQLGLGVAVYIAVRWILDRAARD